MDLRQLESWTKTKLHVECTIAVGYHLENGFDKLNKSLEIGKQQFTPYYNGILLDAFHSDKYCTYDLTIFLLSFSYGNKTG